MVTETLASQTPMGKSKGQKDTSLSEVGVGSAGRGIPGIWFGALSLETSRIKSYVSQAECKHMLNDCCNHRRASMCLSVSKTSLASSSIDLQRG